MVNLTFVRHGKSEFGFDEALNSDLSMKGIEQAEKAAIEISKRISPRKIISSPLLRALHTAEPLSKLWGKPITIANELTEIPSPVASNEMDLKWRRAWLNDIMVQSYGCLATEIESWRNKLYQFILNQNEDAVLFTHFLTVNAAKGFALHDDRVVLCNPGYCEVEQIVVNRGKIYISAACA